MGLATVVSGAAIGGCGGVGPAAVDSAASQATTSTPVPEPVRQSTTPTTAASSVTTAAPTATTLARLPATTSTGSVGTVAPATLVLSTADGRLVVTVGGRTTSAALDGARAPRIALTPDGRSAFLELWDPQNATSLQCWDLTGQPQPAGEAFARNARFPAVSPDGRRLAYSKGQRFSWVLVVRDIATAAERTWKWPDGHEPQQLSWAPDGSRLAIEDSFGGDSGTVIFDTARPEGPVADQPSIGGPYHRATFRGRQGTLVASQIAPGGSSDAVVEVDATTGAVRRTLFTTSFPINGIDSDVSGDHILVVGQNEALYQWSSGGELRLHSRGVLDADW